MLVVVEGPTDETAFGYLLEKLFASKRVAFDIVGGDTTTAVLPSGGSAQNEVRKAVIAHIDRSLYTWRDLDRIVQIVDLDGAFVDDEAVVACEDGLTYELDCIRAADVDSIRDRNRRKSLALRKLIGTSDLKYKNKAVPYRVYFMARNLEHALHNVMESVDAGEKERLAREFQRRYINDLSGFVKYMHSEDVAVAGGYAETWGAVREGTASLHRGSNLHLLLEESEV